MSTISHGPSGAMPERGGWAVKLRVPEMWASIAICVMWLVVLADALWGPDFVSTSAGGNATKIPSAIIFVVFAYVGTRAVAKYGFREHS